MTISRCRRRPGARGLTSIPESDETAEENEDFPAEMKARNVSSAPTVVSVGKFPRLEHCCPQNNIAGGDCSEDARSDLVKTGLTAKKNLKLNGRLMQQVGYERKRNEALLGRRNSNPTPVVQPPSVPSSIVNEGASTTVRSINKRPTIMEVLQNIRDRSKRRAWRP
ncbi:hypothetical protein Salat_1744500 [Sesamum alatum]|uniref:Uncharacterized protein n=1 Tax=Sesamum alatum TaxID=300844 RepID=A0AAE1Y8J9_9LAMI|nr:hypothetical protein Salat_1744500 [Sesamum alatum]